MSYTSESEIENLLGITIPASKSATVASIIAAVKLYIDRYCNKTFEGASATKYYEGSETDRLLIDEFYGTPSAVQILDLDGAVSFTLTHGDGEDYITGPVDRTVKNTLILTGRGVIDKWGCSNKRVLVTATFGNAATVPADIALVATRMAGDIYQTPTTEGELKSVSLGDYSATYADAAETAAKGFDNFAILDGYRDLDI